MTDLISQPAELSFAVTVTSKETGEVTEYKMRGRITSVEESQLVEPTMTENENGES